MPQLNLFESPVLPVTQQPKTIPGVLPASGKSLIPGQCSAQSYYDVTEAKARRSQKERIYSALKRLGKATQRELSKVTDIPRHLVPARLKALGNRVTECGDTWDVETRKRVTLYKVMEN